MEFVGNVIFPAETLPDIFRFRVGIISIPIAEAITLCGHPQLAGIAHAANALERGAWPAPTEANAAALPQQFAFVRSPQKVSKKT